jgi:hypothetical protein
MIVGMACHLLRSEPPMIAVRYTYRVVRYSMDDKLTVPMNLKGVAPE